MLLPCLLIYALIVVNARLPNNVYTPNAECQFEVRRDGPDGPLVTGAEIDMKLYYSIKCKQIDGYCLKVSNCTVSPDDSSSSAYPIIDSDGCSLEESLYEHVQYLNDFTAGIVNPYPIRFRSSSSAVLLYCATSLQPKEGKKCSRTLCTEE